MKIVHLVEVLCFINAQNEFLLCEAAENKVHKYPDEVEPWKRITAGMQTRPATPLLPVSGNTGSQII